MKISHKNSNQKHIPMVGDIIHTRCGLYAMVVFEEKEQEYFLVDLSNGYVIEKVHDEFREDLTSGYSIIGLSRLHDAELILP